MLSASQVYELNWPVVFNGLTHLFNIATGALRSGPPQGHHISTFHFTIELHFSNSITHSLEYSAKCNSKILQGNFLSFIDIISSKAFELSLASAGGKSDGR